MQNMVIRAIVRRSIYLSLSNYRLLLHAWDLTQGLSSYTSGLQTIDNDLAYLCGQLPSKMIDAANANAVMDKASLKLRG